MKEVQTLVYSDVSLSLHEAGLMEALFLQEFVITTNPQLKYCHDSQAVELWYLSYKGIQTEG